MAITGIDYNYLTNREIEVVDLIYGFSVMISDKMVELDWGVIAKLMSIYVSLLFIDVLN